MQMNLELKLVHKFKLFNDILFYDFAQSITTLNSNMNVNTYTTLAQIGLSNVNTLQEIINTLPDASMITMEIGEKTSSGWGSQVPAGYGLLEIKRYHIGRVVLTFWPRDGGAIYIAGWNNASSPSLKPFYRYTGTAV